MSSIYQTTTLNYYITNFTPKWLYLTNTQIKKTQKKLKNCYRNLETRIIPKNTVPNTPHSKPTDPKS